jgi:hypothetical protein
MTHYQVTLDSETLQQLIVGRGRLAQLMEAVLNQVLQA